MAGRKRALDAPVYTGISEALEMAVRMEVALRVVFLVGGGWLVRG
jgi:hypothetical protein